MICKTKSNQIGIKDNGIALFWPPESSWITVQLFFKCVSWKKKQLLITSKIATIKYIHVSKVSMMNNGGLVLLSVKLKIY